MVFFKNLYRYQQEGLLLLRIGIGLMFILHGWPKITGGPETWAQIGGSMGNLGISYAPTFFGFMAAFAEAVGGLCLLLGLFFRPMTLLLFITMEVATIHHITADDGFGGYSHALEAAILFLSLFFIGPGRYSLDQAWFGGEAQEYE
ncbi:DoxX family protein [Rufibacter quisquiliarum]|uniref:Putative oxidoreductase n=1 Tax=Rufibacter quisquiliarum TaxID=1549639 RepID=A0A839G8Z8_9BACT|nr:DoxX family protein [Rufibacter quisquiliarum]MBA9075462.1 putative oxidoreductase [Rufibacter quisquiliarum]